jgi:hypothetical protein
MLIINKLKNYPANSIQLAGPESANFVNHPDDISRLGRGYTALWPYNETEPELNGSTK